MALLHSQSMENVFIRVKLLSVLGYFLPMTFSLLLMFISLNQIFIHSSDMSISKLMSNYICGEAHFENCLW